MTPKVNPTPRSNPHNLVPNVPYDTDSDTSSSDSSLLDSSDSSDDKYYEQIRRAENDKNNFQSKTNFHDTIKKCAKLTSKLLIYAYKSKVVQFKLDEDTLQTWVYLLYLMNSLKIV